MKRSIIFLMALIILCAMPVFASTPEQDMVLIVDEGEQDFSGLQQVSEEEMSGVEGDMFCSAYDPQRQGGSIYMNAPGTSMTSYGECMSDAAAELIKQVGITLIFTGASILIKDPAGKIIGVVSATYSIYKIIQAYKAGNL